jgi:hypothetical protein
MSTLRVLLFVFVAHFHFLSLVVETFSDHVISFRWPVDEELDAGSVVGDLRRSLAPFVDPSALDSYEYQLLPRPNQDLSSLTVDRQSGIVRASGVRRLDRETICPHHHRPISSSGQECVVDISVGLVKNFQLEQVCVVCQLIFHM